MTSCFRPWTRSSTEFLASRKHQTQDSAGFVIGAWPALIASECVDTARSPHTIRVYARDLRRYRSHLLTVKGRKPATANRKLASLSAFHHWARAEGLIPANPAREIIT